jgi:4-amino-4-deoxy-L-arabinose transferase-like glycosyltransferase
MTKIPDLTRFLLRLTNTQALSVVLAVLSVMYLAFIALMYTIGYSFLPGDCPYYRATIVSILEDGDFLLANNVPGDLFNGQLAAGAHGLVSKHPILLPLLSLPFYALLGDWGLLLFNVLNVLIVLALIFFLVRRYYDLSIACATTLLYGTLTIFPAYSYNYSPDVLSTVLVVGGLYALLVDARTVSGTLLGLSIFAKLPNVVPVTLIACYAAYLAVTRHRASHVDAQPGTARFAEVGRAAAFGIALLAALAPLALANYHLYGSVLTNGYERTVRMDANGAILIVHHTAMFRQPLLDGTLRLIFDLHKGLLPTNPVLVLAAIGALFRVDTREHRPEFLLISAICVAQILFFGRYDEWGSSSYGNRFLMTTVALSSVFCARCLVLARDACARRSPATSPNTHQ